MEMGGSERKDDVVGADEWKSRCGGGNKMRRRDEADGSGRFHAGAHRYGECNALYGTAAVT